jgi:hypothetical protein
MMKRLALLLVGMLAVTCTFASDSIIDFDASILTGYDTYNPARSYDIDTTSMKRMPFTLNTPMFLDDPMMSVYGGVIVSNAAATMNQSSTYYQINAGGKDVRLYSSTDSNNNFIFLAQGFKKRFFTGLTSMNDTYSFDSSSELSLLFKSWGSGTSAMTNDARFLVKNGDTYYISEYMENPDTTKSLSITDFNNNSTVGKRWAEYDMDPNAFRIPENMTFEAVSFTNVNYVGFIAQSSRGYGTTYSWTEFAATANRTADPNFGPPSVETEWLTDNVIDDYADATLSLISTGAAPTEVYFFYGTSDGGTTSWDSSIDLGFKDPGSYSAHMSDLDYATTYYYCAMASNSYGATWGDVSTFKSAGMPIIAYVGAEQIDPIPNSTRVAWDESYPIYGEAGGTNVIYFTEDLILSNTGYSQAQVSGAYRMLEGTQGRFGNSTTYYNSKFLARFGVLNNSNDTYYAAAQGVFLWDKELFLYGQDSKVVAMGDSDQMSINITTDYQGGEGLNFVIKNNSVYYFSETQFKTAGNLGIESVGEEKWAIWDPTANPSSFAPGDVLPPLTATFETRTFDNVEAVGITFDFRRNQYAWEFGFDTFVATTTLGGPKGILLIVK